MPETPFKASNQAADCEQRLKGKTTLLTETPFKASNQAEREGILAKSKLFSPVLAAVFLSFWLQKAALSVTNINVEKNFPDYSCEFCGKDKCERFNRKLFLFNLKLNKYLIKPVDVVWSSILPKYGMERLQNAYNNINFPVRVTSCLLQKDFHASKQEVARFFINTTMGVGGLWDPAKTKFKIEANQEDIAQVLYHYKVKQGPYLVLPIVHGNVRTVVGKILDCPFNPCSYVLGPFAIIASTVFFINNSACMQPAIKILEQTCADPYEVLRQIDGVESFIKNNNLDRSNIFLEKIASGNKNLVSAAKIDDGNVNVRLTPPVSADIELKNFNPQSPLVDAMRTVLLDKENPKKSKWAQTSVWNNDFEKKIKKASIRFDNKLVKYTYRYILQKDKNAPAAIIYPAIGEGVMAEHSTTMTRILYDQGYSVIVLGSPFNWEFIKSMPDNYKPGLPSKDTDLTRLLTLKIINRLEAQYKLHFSDKIIVGSSFGALVTLFTAAKEEKENILGVSKFIAINPPIELMFAQRQIDKYAQDWKNSPSDIKMRAAVTVQKVIKKTEEIAAQKPTESVYLPFDDDEAKLIAGFVMKQKLADTVFSVEKCSRCKKDLIHDEVNNMTFDEYAQKYVLAGEKKPYEQIDYESSLYSISDYLKNNDNYKIYHTVDDYFVNSQQLAWLKNQAQDKALYFSNGSHLGYLYRREFLDDFKGEIKLKNSKPQQEKRNLFVKILKPDLEKTDLSLAQ